MTTTGVVGGHWRATVTPWGAVVPSDGSPVLDWHVAADDRWHSPSAEPTVRQTLLDGLPLVETKLRVPSGDAVQRVWSVADGGGHTVVSVTNESPLPIAVAFTRPDVRSARPAADVPVQGIELPAGSVTFPVGHHATLTVALAHTGGSEGLPPLPSFEQVAAGWRAQLSRAGRLVLPDDAWVSAVLRARSELLLCGPVDDTPLELAHGIVDLVRLGEPVERWLPDLAAAAGEAGRGRHPLTAHVLHGVRRLFAAADERRAVRDLTRALARLAPVELGWTPQLDASLVAAEVEARLVTDRDDGAVLLAAGLPELWRGSNFEVHDLPVGVTSSMSYAVRWHGERPAVLWELSGEPLPLHGPAGWRSGDAKGETLWPADLSAATV